MKHDMHDKIKLIKDHCGKPLKRPIYGYVVDRTDFKDHYKDGVATEAPTNGGVMQTQGEAYLIQTSWTGGAIWYSDKALLPAGGVNQLGAWRKRLHKYHEAQAMKHGAY